VDHGAAHARTGLDALNRHDVTLVGKTIPRLLDVRAITVKRPLCPYRPVTLESHHGAFRREAQFPGLTDHDSSVIDVSHFQITATCPSGCFS
jgi:hypothetical protein